MRSSRNLGELMLRLVRSGVQMLLAVGVTPLLASCGMQSGPSISGPLTQVAPGIAAGNGHVVAREQAGTVVSWGMNNYGQDGDGTVTDRLAAIQLRSLGGVISVAAGSVHSLALKSDGTVWAWGADYVGQLGQGFTSVHSTTPREVNALANVVRVAAGGDHSDLIPEF